MFGLCRSCKQRLAPAQATAPCPHCGSRRTMFDPDLPTLTIAHIDCDAFYAAVEKRENPKLRNTPLIVGGRKRGVVTTACYIARMYGVRSAMAMAIARAKCPQAVIVKPRMALYREAGLQIRDAMRRMSPKVQPVSIDEAYVDLTDCQRLHGRPAYALLLDFQQWVERELGLTLSIGLAHNKLLAKIASDLEKPRGFSVLGPSTAADFLTDKPVSILWGVGPALTKSLAQRGVRTIGDIRRFSPLELERHFGTMGPRLAAFARGEDARRVSDGRSSKSISAETTFHSDLGGFEQLRPHVARLIDRVMARAQRAGLASHTLTLKLKTPDFQSLTRQQKNQRPLASQAQMTEVAETLLRRELSLGPFRLIGIGLSDFGTAHESDGAEQAVLLSETP